MKKTIKVESWEYKYPMLDLYDAHRPNVPGFVHDEHYVGGMAVEFHGTAVSGAGQLENGKQFYCNYGVSKRLFRASKLGYKLNGYTYNTGKNDCE